MISPRRPPRRSLKRIALVLLTLLPALALSSASAQDAPAGADDAPAGAKASDAAPPAPAASEVVPAAAPEAAPAKPAATRPAGKDRVDLAVDRAIRFIVSKQNPADGSICDKPHNRTAITALAVLSIACAGHQPTDPTPEGRAMQRALRYCLANERAEEDGYYGNKDGSKMYGHGIITLMLGEMLGMGVDEETDALIRRRLSKAVPLILKAQQINKGFVSQGGWRYTPDTEQSDISVTVWQINALRSARNAGLQVPQKAIDDALQYVRSCYLNHVDVPGKPFGFAYTATSMKYMSTSSTAMGLLSLELCGEFDSPVARGTTAYLADNPPIQGNVWLFYGAYYYAQAMFQAGGQHAVKGRQHVQQLLLPEQRPDGSWESPSEKEREVGSVFTSSLGVLALGVKYHFLPIYQR